MNNQLILVIAETSQEPIGPCELVEQSEDSSRHSLMASWRTALDSGAHPIVGYYFKDLHGRSVRIVIRAGVSVRMRFKIRLGLV